MLDIQPTSHSLRTLLRVTVVALFVDGDEVLMLHQMSSPELDRWDLPGGGLEPTEPILVGLRREVWEETGIQDFQCDRLLTVFEQFFPDADAPTCIKKTALLAPGQHYGRLAGLPDRATSLTVSRRFADVYRQCIAEQFRAKPLQSQNIK